MPAARRSLDRQSFRRAAHRPELLAWVVGDLLDADVGFPHERKIVRAVRRTFGRPSRCRDQSGYADCDGGRGGPAEEGDVCSCQPLVRRPAPKPRRGEMEDQRAHHQGGLAVTGALLVGVACAFVFFVSSALAGAATLHVTVSGDGAGATLRNQIAAAKPADTVEIDAGVNPPLVDADRDRQDPDDHGPGRESDHGLGERPQPDLRDWVDHAWGDGHR